MVPKVEKLLSSRLGALYIFGRSKTATELGLVRCTGGRLNGEAIGWRFAALFPTNAQNFTRGKVQFAVGISKDNLAFFGLAVSGSNYSLNQ